MSKVLKIAAAVVGAAAIIVATGGAAAFGIAGALSTTIAGTAISAGALLTVSSALSIGSSLLAKRPKAPSVNAANVDRLNSTIDLRTPRKIVWGNTAGANDVRDQEYTDNQTFLHRFIVVASHKVHSIYEIWFDDEKAWDSVSGVAAKFSGYLTVTPVTEGNAGNAINISPRMGSSRRYTGLAYVYLSFKLTGNTKKTESPFVQSIPTRVTIRTKGALVYDPRKDSTVPGGSGSHRANDQSTWEWDDDAARNPALQMLWWMLGWRINGKLAVGGGIPPSRIDLESFITAANLCDEDVSIEAGGTEPRYRGDGVVSEGDSPTVIMDALKAAMNADLDDVGGKLRLFVFHNDLGTPLADFTDDDILGAFEYRATAALDESFNVVRGTYTDPRDQALYQQIDYPQVELPSRDGIDRIDTFPLALVQSPSQAQRLAKQRLQRMQFGGVFTATGQATWWKVQKNSVVRLTFAPRGWVNKLFRVAELEHRVDGTVPITLREESNQIYAWDEEEGAPVQPNNGMGYNRAQNPIVIAIDDSGAVIPTPGSPVVSTVRNEFGVVRNPGELLNSEIELTASGRLQYRPLPDAEPLVLGQVTREDIGAVSEAAMRRAEDDIDQMARALATALDEASTTRATFRDAGFYVDAATGQIRIHAVEQTRERVSSAEVRLNAAEASITLRATTSYVNEQIALAVIDPSQIAELEDIFLRLGEAEITISGLEAEVTTLATATELSLVAGRVTTAEEAIDALEGTITTKVDTTTFNALESRVTTAESTLTAIGDTAQIINAVSATRLLEKRQDDNAEADLRALLLGDRAKRDQVAATAAARQELTARIVDGDAAEASFRQALQVRVGAAEAAVATESIARASGDAALASQITSLSASTTTSLNSLATSIANETSARTTAINAEADARIAAINAEAAARGTAITAEETARIAAINDERTQTLADVAAEAAARAAEVSTLNAAITSEQTARTNADTALATDITDLSASLTSNVATLQTNINNANQARIDGDGALAASISSLSAELDTEVSNRAAAVESEAQARVAADGLIAAGLAQQVTAGRVVEGLASELADQLLTALLLNDKNRREVNGAVAAVQQEITAQVVSATEAFATSILALVARAAANEASIIQESLARVTADESLATSITSLNASFTGALSAEATARTNAIAAEATTRAGQVSALEGDISNTIGRIDDEEDARIAGDAANADALSGAVTTLTASISNEATARASADGALAGQITTLNTTVAGQSATLTQFAESIDGLEARWGVKVDANGRVGGFVVNGTAEDIDATFVVDNFSVVDPDTGVAFLDADADGLRLQNGKVVMNNGTNMLVMGAGFGVDNQFVMWFGPSRAIHLCNEADALFFLDVTGDGEYGLRLGSNFYKNSGSGSSLADNAEVTVGPFITEGGSKQVQIGYRYRRSVQITNAFSYTGTPSVTIRLERAVAPDDFEFVGNYTFNGSATGANGSGESEPGFAIVSVNGNASFTDNTPDTEDFTYRARIVSRSVDGLGSTVLLEEDLAQTVTLVITEQIT